MRQLRLRKGKCHRASKGQSRESESGVLRAEARQTYYRTLPLCLAGFPCLPLHDLYPAQTLPQGQGKTGSLPWALSCPFIPAQPEPPENGEQGLPSGEGTFAWNALLLPSIGPVPPLGSPPDVPL